MSDRQTRSPRLRRFADKLAHIKISLDPPSPPFLSPSPLGDIIAVSPSGRRMDYLQVPGDTSDLFDSSAFNFRNAVLSSPPPDRRTSFASTMSDTTNSESITIPMSSSYQNLLSPMWSTVKYQSDDNDTPPNEPMPRRSKSALSNRSSSDCINVPPIVFSPILSRPLRSISPTMSVSPTMMFRSHHNSDSESDTGAVPVNWKGSGSCLMIPRRSFNYQHLTSQNDSELNASSNMDRFLKRNRRKTMAIHGTSEQSEGGSSTGWSSSSMTNLCRIRSSLGHSDPQLSASPANTSASPSSSKSSTSAAAASAAAISLRPSAQHRPSIHASTSPVTLQRCRSPLRVPQRSTSSTQNIGAANAAVNLRGCSARSSLMAPVADTRRWSLASLPSTSGYGTPGTGSNSGVSSQYSSSEQIGEMIDGMRIAHGYPTRQNSSRFDSNDSYDDTILGGNGANSPHNTSGGSSSSNWLNRPRSRSLTSPAKFLNEYNLEMVNRTSVYKERFPRAKLQMEERLGAFVAENGPLSGGVSAETPAAVPVPDTSAETAMMRSRRSTVLEAESYADRALLRLIGDGATRFLHHQIVEIALDCLTKSKEDSITCSYFCEMSQRLEETLNEAQIKTSPESLEYLSKLVKKLLMIVSRPARLLECLEFDPDEFYHLLEEAEGVVREQLGSGTARVPDLPQYIIGKLGLDRDPLLDDDTNDDDVEETRHVVASDVAAATNRAPREDDFDTIRLVSNGAYGAVYLVRHRETRQRFALKKMNKQTLMLRNQVDQVFAERDILTMADNPFVVSFYGSFETRQYLCMLMEYVEGGDCAALLKMAGTLPIEVVRLYVAETVLAIEYLHSYGIVHRDLKPDNLLITAMGHIKLTDFGLSKIGLMNRTTLVAEGYDTPAELQQQFQDKQLCGTPEYIAPEVIIRAGYGKPVDWWALGIILYEFLVGIVPFFGETPEILFSKVISEDVEYPEDEEALPPEAEDLCRKLLEKNPAERLGTLNGAAQLTEHAFFAQLDFTTILRQKAEFVPQLDNEEDTSYFDTRSDRYNHDAESNDGDDDPNNTSNYGSSTMFHSFSTASPRHSIVAIDAAHLSQLAASAAAANTATSLSSQPIERSHSISVHPSHHRQEYKPERSYSTGGATSSSPHVADDSGAVNLRRRFSAQRHTVSTTSSSGTGSGTHFAPTAAASSTDSSIDVPATSATLLRRSPLPRFAISCEGANEEEEPVRFRHQEKEQKLKLVIPATTATSTPKGDVKETCYVMYSNPVPSTSTCQLSPGGISISSASSVDVQSPAASASASQPTPSTSSSSAGGGGGGAIDSATSSADAAMSKNICIRKGPFGFGFTLKSVRVYLGETSEYFTIEHIVTAVVDGSPAHLARLQPEDMITHVNGHPVHNLTHPQLMHRLLSNGNELNLRVTPLAATSIKEGAARRNVGKMAKKKPKRPQRRAIPLEKKTRKPSALLRRLSGKKATGGDAIVPGSSSQKQAFMPRSASSQEGHLMTTTTTTTSHDSSAAATNSGLEASHHRPCPLRSSPSPSASSSTCAFNLDAQKSAAAAKRKSSFFKGSSSGGESSGGSCDAIVAGGIATSGIAVAKSKSHHHAVSPLARETRLRSPSPSVIHRTSTTTTVFPGTSKNSRSPMLSTTRRRSSYQPSTTTVLPQLTPTTTTTVPPRGFSAAAQSAQNLLNRILPAAQTPQQSHNVKK